MHSLKQFLTHRGTIRVCQLLIGLLFALAALGKLGDLQSFAVEVHNFRLMPLAVEHLVAMTLPWVELVAALALLLGVRARSGAMVAAALMSLFTIAVLIAMARGLDIECGCFGTADGTRVGGVKFLENAGMLALAAVGSLRRRNSA
jgi:putative oxidoreductase